MNSTQVRTQAEARFNGGFDSASIIREAISKERGYELDRGILPNEVNIPKYNPIAIIFFAGACEVCLVVGFLIGRWI